MYSLGPMRPPKILLTSVRALWAVALLSSAGCGGPPPIVGTIAGTEFIVGDILSSKADAKTPVLRILLSSGTNVCMTSTKGAPLDGHQLLYLTVNTYGPGAVPAGPGMYNISDMSVLQSKMGTEDRTGLRASTSTGSQSLNTPAVALTPVPAGAGGVG